MTHFVRGVDRPGALMRKKGVVDAVSIVKTPPMVVVGIVGYFETPSGLRTLKSSNRNTEGTCKSANSNHVSCRNVLKKDGCSMYVLYVTFADLFLS